MQVDLEVLQTESLQGHWPCDLFQAVVEFRAQGEGQRLEGEGPHDVSQALVELVAQAQRTQTARQGKARQAAVEPSPNVKVSTPLGSRTFANSG